MEKSPLSPTAAPKSNHISTAAAQQPVSPAKSVKAGGAVRPVKIDKESARVAIVAAWPSWADENLAGRTAKDNDLHAFLRFLRSEHPELFAFRTNRSPHETAFFWLLDAGFAAV